MTETPLLSEADVRLEVERLFRRDHRSKLLALFGRGQPGRFELDGLKWEIIPTACELELRSKLPAPGEPSTMGSVYLVDWAEDALPLDVSCRLAGGRIYHVARDARLAALFGARQVDQGLASTALARLVLSGGVDGLRKITGLRLTTRDLWKRVLEARFGIPEGALESGATWLRWVRSSDAGPAFARSCEADDLLRAVRRELLVWLEERLGSVGVLGFRAWELGLVDRAIQALLLLAAVEQSEDAYLRGLVNGQIASIVPGLANEVRGAHASGTAAALLESVLSVEDETDRRLLEGAQQHATNGGASALATASDWLPAGHAAREANAAAAVTKFVDAPSAESLEAVLAAFDHLSAHRLDRAIRRSEHVEARRMAARLSAWLLARRVRPQLAEHGTPWQPAIELARRYTEEGGFLDWARQSLRGMRGAGDALMAAVRRLYGAVDAVARADDQRFAKAYVSWVEAGKPSNEVLPIEHVTKRVVAQFLKGEHRRLLLVLMDGMSYAAAVQVLQRLRDQRRWSPIAWRTPGWNGQLAIPPVLAAAPTLTEVSRAALFAGVADPRFGDQGTDRDDARWASNPHVRELVGEEPLRVFFRREIHAGHELIDDVKRAVAGDQRVVAVVVNAIDEQLKGSLQVAVDYSKTPILPLEALLSAADGAERAVLLVADHGHVAGDAMRVAGGRIPVGREGGARWRALAEGEQPQDGEVLLPRTSWKPRGAAGVAALWDTALANRAPHYGEHGGLSLAEAVAPAFLIAPEWLDRVAGDDVELSCRVLPEPDWWALKIARPAATPVVSAEEPRTPATAQLQLIPVGPAKTPTAPPPAPSEPALIVGLRASKLFTQQVAGVPKPEYERVLTWLAVLVEAGGSLTAADFARLCGVRPHQVGGVVARLGVLNADGFAIVEHDVAGRRVVLHRARLLSQFGVTG